MFKKKNKKQAKEKKLNLDIQTIPDVFYGGKNPVIYKTEKNEQAELRQKNKEKNNFSKKKKIIFIIILSLICFILISIYVVYDYFQSNLKTNINTITEKQNNYIEEVEEPEEEEIEEVEEPEEEEIEEVEEAEEEAEEISFLNFPPIIMTNSADSDSDELTDLEEAVFGLDTGAWDTDLDGYYDGQEVVNLYNPKGFAPVKIIDSGLVSEYVNPAFSYRLYYPQVWEKGEVDKDFKQVIFSSDTGDYISVNIFEKESGQDFYDWFSKNIKEQKANDLISFVNKFKNKAMMRRDELVYYFENNKYMIVLIYNPRDVGPIKYRHIFEMIAQSFRFSETEEMILEDEMENNNLSKQEDESSLEINTSTDNNIEEDPIEESNNEDNNEDTNDFI